MEYLLNNPNKVISKELLIEKIWGYDSDAEYNNVEVYISFLRKKLRHIHSATSIKTVRGVGRAFWCAYGNICVYVQLGGQNFL